MAFVSEHPFSSKTHMRILNSLSWSLVILACLTLGLAPFVPEPHVWEKLRMLAAGDLHTAIDIFDLFLHGTPWLILLAKLIARAYPVKR